MLKWETTFNQPASYTHDIKCKGEVSIGINMEALLIVALSTWFCGVFVCVFVLSLFSFLRFSLETECWPDLESGRTSNVSQGWELFPSELSYFQVQNPNFNLNKDLESLGSVPDISGRKKDSHSLFVHLLESAVPLRGPPSEGLPTAPRRGALQATWPLRLGPKKREGPTLPWPSTNLRGAWDPARQIHPCFWGEGAIWLASPWTWGNPIGQPKWGKVGHRL